MTDWHNFYMDIAERYAKLSKDPRTKVGAILVPEDFSKILGVGFNGWEKGGANVPDSLEPGESGAVHAEINCLLKVDNKLQYPHSNIYITHSPCKVCSRAIVNFGTISRVIYKIEYRDTAGIDILKSCNIDVIKL